MLRKAEADRIQLQINAQIAQIDAEKAAIAAELGKQKAEQRKAADAYTGAHSDEDENNSGGAVAACVIGSIIMFGFIIVLVLKMVRDKRFDELFRNTMRGSGKDNIKVETSQY